MRIIAGEFKGRRLEMPEGTDVRPTSEKVKEALFSILMHYVPDAVVVDLFTGTGNLGLEAISRGAEKCYFCDNSRESISLTKRNIAHCKAEDRSVVISGDFERCLRNIASGGDKADIIILDPPYKEGMYDSCFELIRELDLLSESGAILAEHNKKDVLPEEYFGYKKLKDRDYGTITLTVYIP